MKTVVFPVFAALLIVTVRHPARTAIVVGPLSSARPVSPMLYGTQVFWPRQGNGALVAPYHRLKQPVTFNSFFLQMAREMPVSTLRFQGDNTYYWRYGVGPYHLRPGTNFGHYGNGIWANDFGTDEFVSLCRAIGAEPVVVAPYIVARRPVEGAPIADQLAANWVEYCNAPSPGLDYGRQQGWEPTTFTNSAVGLAEWEPHKEYSPGDRVRFHGAAFQCIQAHISSYALEPGGQVNWRPYWSWLEPDEISIPGKSWKATEKAPAGYFAWLREYFGRKEPYNIRYWEIGNEEWAWGREGGPSWGRPAEYAKNALRIIKAMKAVDPTIRCGINMPGPLDYDRRSFQEAVCGKPPLYSEVYEAADFLVWHISLGTNRPNKDDPASEYKAQFAAVDAYEEAHKDLVRDYPKPVFITEFNVRYGLYDGADPNDQVHMHRLKSGLLFACMFNQFARLGFTAVHQLLFADVGGWYESRLFRMIYQDINGKTRAPREGVTPTYLAMKLYSRFGRGQVIDTVVRNEVGIHAQAFRDPVSKRLRLFVVNQSPDTAKTVNLYLGDFRLGAPIKVYVLTAAGGMESSNEDDPGSVSISESVLSSASVLNDGYRFPPHSLTVLDIPEINRTSQLDVAITANNTSPQPGEEVLFIVTARNTGEETLESGTVEFSVPAGMNYVPGTSVPEAEFNPEMGMLRWQISGILPGHSRQLRCRVRLR